MKKEEKEKLLDMLQEVSYAHEEGTFWKTWSAVHKELSAMPVEQESDVPVTQEKPRMLGDVTVEELAAFDSSRKFHCRNDAGEKKMFVVENKRTVLIYNGKRDPEQVMSCADFLASHCIIGDADTTSGWRTRIRETLQKLDSSGLWPQFRKVLENILRSEMTWEDRCFLSALRYNEKTGKWTTEVRRGNGKPYFVPAAPEKVNRCIKSYPFAFDGRFVKPEYIAETTKCRSKLMTFLIWRHEIEDDIKDHIKKGEDYRTSEYLYTEYGITFDFNALTKEAFYMEEHRRIGSMYWCIALDHRTALFCEPVTNRIQA